VWRRHPAGKQPSPADARLGFLGEQEPQYELKTRLARSFKGLPNVRAAYLTRVTDGASVDLRLCVRTELGHDQCVMRCAESAFASLATGSPAVDAGSNPEGFLYDQRGPLFPRVVGAGPDIGAIEGVTSRLNVPVPALAPWLVAMLSALLGVFGLRSRRRST